MSAAYDTYDYPAYWQGRDYEHNSELIALRAYLNKIPEINRLIDIGAGFGRLTPTYFYRAKKIFLTDASAKLLKIARTKFKQEKINIVQTCIENLPKKVRRGSTDVAVLVRVLHHIKDIDSCFKIINRILINRGYFIIEFANKSHFKATVSEFFKGNFTYLLDIFPQDKRSRKSKRLKTLPFVNYHPDVIEQKLIENGFEIIEKRSVSNTRSSFLKHHLPKNLLLSIESFLQIPLAKINFGPSIFILARKIG